MSCKSDQFSSFDIFIQISSLYWNWEVLRSSISGGSLQRPALVSKSDAEMNMYILLTGFSNLVKSVENILITTWVL